MKHLIFVGILLAVAACSPVKDRDLSVLTDSTASGSYRDIVPAGTWPANHGSTIVELSDAELLACWFAGSREAGRDVQIVCSHFDREAVAWQPPTVAVKQKEYAAGSWYNNKFVGNPSLFLDSEGILWLFYEAVQWGGHSGAYIDYKVSRDQGRSWSAVKRLVGMFGNFGHLPRNKAIALGGGTFMLPVYREFTSKYGYTFTITARGGEIVAKEKHVIPGSEHIQPTLISVPEKNRVMAWMRNTDNGNVLHVTFDTAAKKWSSPVATNLPNPDSAVDSVLMPDGRYLLAYNHSATGRNPLSLAVSADGVNFTRIYDIENAGEGSFSYPAIIHTTDGQYHVTYTYGSRSTIRHFMFSQAWLDSIPGVLQ